MYIKTPAPGHNLPELISYDGDPMLLMEFTKGFLAEETFDKGLAIAKNKATHNIKRIALTKLKKGQLVDNHGKLYANQNLIFKYKELYTNSGELLQDVEKAKNFGFKHHGKPFTTTKGISQYDHFATNGKRVSVLRMIKEVTNVFDIFSLTQTVQEDLDTSQSLPLDFGPLSPIADLAGVMVKDMKAEQDEMLEEAIQIELLEAKLKGLQATREFVNSINHNEQYKWQLMPISDLTATKLIQGEFKTFDELDYFNRNSRTESNNIYVLYREIFNKSREDFIYMIETIFIND